MNKNLCPPYKGAKLSDITQGYSDSHRAYDWASDYGTFLVAMENCIVENIMTAENWDTGWELERGYGILLRSITNPEVKYSYWHCLPRFSVNIGEIVIRGQVIAMMGNTGFVLSNGKVVLMADKLRPSYPGSHVHLSCPQDTIDRIDWSIPINFDIITVISLTLKQILNFLKKSIIT